MAVLADFCASLVSVGFAFANALQLAKSQVLERLLGKMTDTLSDLLTRLRNATMASKELVMVKPSRAVTAVLKVLEEEGFVIKTSTTEDHCEVRLNTAQPIIHIKRLSKPGIRRYVKSSAIPRPRTGLGLIVISTPKGVLSGNQARKQKVGGELICEVW